MARPLDVKPKTYDETKLTGMVPPFTVRIEKIKGSTRMPIPLPDGDDGEPGGTGWGFDEVRQLESWLVTEWAGGGLYEVNLMDSSPQPQSMKWQPFWDPKNYPEKTPPPLVDAASAMAPPPPMQPSNVVNLPFVQHPQPQPQGRFMPAPFSNGLPPGYGFQQTHPTQQYYPTAPMPNPPMPGTFQWEAYQREVERRERENRDREVAAELKRERDKNERIERESIAAKHAADLERERQAANTAQTANKQEMAELRAMIAGLASAIKEGSSNNKPNADVEAMREQMRQTEAKLDRERGEREAERRDALMRDQIKAMNDGVKQQMEMLQRQFDDRTRAVEAAALRDNKPDQMMMMWQNSQREQMELSKELSRNQLSQMTALQAYMMNPRDMMNMAKESSASIDQATERVTRFFGQVIDTQQKVTENLLQMQPGSNGVVELVGNGMDRIGSLAERYLGGKQLEIQLQQQGQVQVAEANARAYATAAVAQAQAQAPQPQPQPMPQSQGAGLGNPAPQAQAQAPRPTNGAAKPKAQAQTSNEPKRLGKTDAEWFGVIMPQVAELRTNANKFIEALRAQPPKLDKQGNPLGWDPEAASTIIAQAVGIVVQKQIVIPVMMELLFQDRFADFVDVLLPEPIVTQAYRDDVVQNLIRLSRVAQGLPPDGPTLDQSQGAIEVVEASSDDTEQYQDEPSDDNDDADDEPTDDEGHDGKVVSIKPIAKPPAPKAPVRRA